MNNKDLLQCKYSGDKDDEFCVKCDGINVKHDVTGEYFPADVGCGGYEPSDIKIDSVKIDEPVNTTQPKPEDTQRDSENLRELNDNTQSGTIVSQQGKTVEIKAESGVSVELKNKTGSSQWYKFSYSETRTVPEDCDIEYEKQCLWTDVHSSVDKQVEETINSLQ